jgi:hypothetical protein
MSARTAKPLAEGGRNRSPQRLMDVERPIEEKYWTAKEWAMRTRIPYRTILSAAARGELAAVRPSGTAHGCILISESSWAAWIEGARLRIRVPGRVDRQPQARQRRSLAELALS